MDRKTVSDRGVSGDSAPGPIPARPPAAPNHPDVPRVSGGVSSHSQRVSPRTALPCRVLVNVGKSYRMARAVHDISLAGIYVELEAADLVLGDLVEIVLEFDDGQRAQDLQLSAVVARVDSNGVGLRFCAYGDQTYTDLVNVLYAR